MTKLDAYKLRRAEPTAKELSRITRNPIVLVLDNILDTYNIGSMFRLADAIAAEKIYLCGNMEYPPSSRIHKAAVGTENWIPWEKMDSALEAVQKLKKEGKQIVTIEQHKSSVPLKDFTPHFPVALVAGHESQGVSREVVENSDTVVELPMYGVNKSFNVWGATAVVAYKILENYLP